MARGDQCSASQAGGITLIAVRSGLQATPGAPHVAARAAEHRNDERAVGFPRMADFVANLERINAMALSFGDECPAT